MSDQMPPMPPTQYLGHDADKGLIYAAVEAERDALRAALEKIERWELPGCGPCSYETVHGEIGAREYMRAAARAALAAQPKAEPVDAPSAMTYSHNILTGVADWLQSRSNTVWAERGAYGGLMRSWAQDLREIDAALAAQLDGRVS